MVAVVSPEPMMVSRRGAAMAIVRRIRPGRTRTQGRACRLIWNPLASARRPIRRSRSWPRTSTPSATRLVEETAALSPTLATLAGIRGYDHLWDDFSSAGYERQKAAMEDQLARVRAAATGDDAWGALAAEVSGGGARGRT